MPLKHSACVVNNGKNQVSSRHYLLKESRKESIVREGLRLKNIFLTQCSFIPENQSLTKKGLSAYKLKGTGLTKNVKVTKALEK